MNLTLLEKPDFVDLLHLLSSPFKNKVQNGLLIINPAFGKGYCWAEKLPCGITVFVSDTVLDTPVSIERLDGQQHYFTLQFNEEAQDESDTKAKSRRNNEDFQSHVKLSQTLVPEKFDFPSGKRLRSVKFFFSKNHLSQMLGKHALEQIIGQQFPSEIKSEKLDPIATEYRVTLDDLWTDKMNQPLKLNYIQNRVMLLLETYLVKLYERRDTSGKKVRRTEDETLRLMKVEALLVKNFQVSPPTIQELSRISAMSSTKLKQDFKALYGLPIYEYFQKNRMLKAKSLLVLGKYTIKEVGMQVGYTNLSHFASSFKKEFGFLPSEIAARDGMLIYSNR